MSGRTIAATRAAAIRANYARTYRTVTGEAFRLALRAAQRSSALVASATTPVGDLPTDATFRLAGDARSGYAVTSDGELVGVFSLERGRGDTIVSHAVANGANHLDCFDGYLPELYGRHGFVETQRVPNWTPGGPDVVYMALAAALPAAV